MTPLEQLKTLHGEALTRLSEHPDFQLIKQLEPIIAALEAEQAGTISDEVETPAVEMPEETEADSAQSEEALADDAAGTASMAALGAAVAAGNTTTEQLSAAHDADDAVETVGETIETSIESETPQAFVAEEQPAVETHALETTEAPVAEAVSPAPEPQIEPEAQTLSADTETELNANDFETEEAFVGSLDEQLSDALSNTDFAADVEAASIGNAEVTPPSADIATQEAPDVLIDEIGATSSQKNTGNEAGGQAMENEIASEIEQELSIEALIDEQVAKLLSEERPA